MIISFDLLDIDGNSIQLGDRVLVYQQAYEVVDREGNEVTIDIDRPLPVADVPWFVGVVQWGFTMLRLEVAIEESLREGIPPASISMGGPGYSFQVIERNKN